jgi:hypothetical protein
MSEREQESKQKITVLIPIDIVSQVKRLAKMHQRSFNGELIWALQRYVEQAEKQEKHEQK